MVKIFIDPGHGGADSGATGNGLQEKNLNLQISIIIRDRLLSLYENVEVLMSRTSDQTISLTERTNMANSWGADFLLSVHVNAGGGTGYEDYRHTTASSSSSTGRIHATIHQFVMAELTNYNVRDRGMKQANFHMLRESKMPAVLTENLFIDSSQDAALLKNLEFLYAVAYGHVLGLENALNLKRKDNKELNGVIPNWANWQWEEAAAIYRRARLNGILTSDRWEKKAATKELTFDEIAFLNLVINGRSL